MIDESILDKVIPVPDRDELKDEIIDELKEEGFKVTNFQSGGIFYHLLMIIIWIYIELLGLARTMLNSMFLSHAEDEWLELKSEDFSKTRKQPSKAQGYVTITRDVTEDSLTITKGHVFKTKPNVQGEEFKYYVMEAHTMQIGEPEANLLVEAERTGARFNVSENQIIHTMIHLENVINVTNKKGWLRIEGADIESLESLRRRDLNSWSELSNNPIRDKYKNIAESVIGVLSARVDDQHPRGQGTVDIIITSTAGKATEALLTKVEDAIIGIKGNYDDVLIKSSETVMTDFEIVIYLSENASHEGVVDQAESIVKNLMSLSDRELNVLYKDEIVHALKNSIVNYRRSDIIKPVGDIELDADKVLILGNIEISVKNIKKV